MAPSNVSSDYVDFEVIKEPWNVYQIEDGSIIRVKLILIKVLQTGERDSEGNPLIAVNTNNVVGVLAPEELRGEPTKPPTSGSYEIEKDDLSFQSQHEDWSEYKMVDGKDLKIKPAITKISKTTSFDSHGEPIYMVRSQPLVK